MLRYTPYVVMFAFVLGFASGGWAEDEPAAPAAAEEEKPQEEATEAKPEAAKKEDGETHTVRRGPFKVEVSLTGVFEARSVAELSITPLEWSEWNVVKAVEHGAVVNRGDPVIWFDSRKLEHTIAEREAGQALARLALAESEAAAAKAEAEAPLTLATVRRSHEQAAQDWEYFQKVGKAMTERRSDFTLKLYEYALEGAAEELAQLEKMYKADDLTEETEEIVLKRARRDVDYAKFSLEEGQLEREHERQFEMPRREQALQQALRSAELARQAAEISVPREVEETKLALAKDRYDLKVADEQLARLKEDLKQMVQLSPAAGAVYYGRCVRGTWLSESATASLRGGAATPRDVLLTIVSPGEIQVRAKASAAELGQLKRDLAGVVTCEHRRKTRLPAKLAAINAAPGADQHVDVTISLEDPLAAGLNPGLPCTVKFRVYTQPEAIAVPKKAVFTDELDDTLHYVYVVGEDGDAERRDVEVGETNDDHSEITRGLDEEEVIRLEKPKA